MSRRSSKSKIGLDTFPNSKRRIEFNESLRAASADERHLSGGFLSNNVNLASNGSQKVMSMDETSIRQLFEEDWEIYRDIRLDALKKEPAFFSPSRDETAFSEADWRGRLRNSNAASFGLSVGKEIVGMSGIVREGNDVPTERAFLVGSYIRKDFRRRGLSERLFQARIEWARAQKNIETLVLEHRVDNTPMQRAHQKFGFRLVDSRDQVWPDGTSATCLVYELRI